MSLEGDDFLHIDLDELDEPHKLSKWILLLPKYRSGDEDHNIDYDAICKLFSKFIYQSQLCGHHIKYDFDENNYKEILNIIYGKHDYSHYEWMWKIIEKAQTNDGDDDDPDGHKLEWIQSNWKRYETLEQDEHQPMIDEFDQLSDEHNEYKQINDHEEKNQTWHKEPAGMNYSHHIETDNVIGENEAFVENEDVQDREMISSRSGSELDLTAQSDIFPVANKNRGHEYGTIRGSSASDASSTSQMNELNGALIEKKHDFIKASKEDAQCCPCTIL